MARAGKEASGAIGEVGRRVVSQVGRGEWPDIGKWRAAGKRCEWGNWESGEASVRKGGAYPHPGFIPPVAHPDVQAIWSVRMLASQLKLQT